MRGLVSIVGMAAIVLVAGGLFAFAQKQYAGKQIDLRTVESGKQQQCLRVQVENVQSEDRSRADDIGRRRGGGEPVARGLR